MTLKTSWSLACPCQPSKLTSKTFSSGLTSWNYTRSITRRYCSDRMTLLSQVISPCLLFKGEQPDDLEDRVAIFSAELSGPGSLTPESQLPQLLPQVRSLAGPRDEGRHQHPGHRADLQGADEDPSLTIHPQRRGGHQYLPQEEHRRFEETSGEEDEVD